MGNIAFGTVGSPHSTPPKPGGSVGAIRQITAIGLHALELGWVQAVRVTERTCEEIRAAAGDTGVAISVHAPYYINLNATDEEWPKSKKRLLDAATYGELAGATDIIFHPGAYLGHEPKDALSVGIARLSECREELDRRGVHVTLRPETMGKQGSLGTLDETLSMSLAVEGVLPCIDFAHLHARTGNGSMNSKPEWKQALSVYAERLGPEALGHLHVHLSGIAYGPRGEKNHLTFAEADLDWRAILETLLEMNCSGRILCESPIMEQDALTLQRYWLEIGGATP